MKNKNNRMHSKWLIPLFRRRIIIILLLALQIAFISYIIISSSRISSYIDIFFRILSVIAALFVLNSSENKPFKMILIFMLLCFPIFGGLFYIMFTRQTSEKRIKKRYRKINAEAGYEHLSDNNIYYNAINTAGSFAPIIRYLHTCAGFNVYNGSETKYFSPGERMLDQMLTDLKKAEKYIYLEYFIISGGVMWDSILDILKSKAKEGIDVRLIYDDMGCFFLLPKNYPKILASYGIKCVIFNPFRPVLSAVQNNRDHRKICVIDGKTAFTGGINLADEYINVNKRCGYWKDAGIRVSGNAALEFTDMFIRMWQLCSNSSIIRHNTEYKADFDCESFVIPYCDNPKDNKNVGANIYLQLISKAEKYLYINTPYLIIDDQIAEALCLCAKSGVDVKIITPSKSDNKLAQFTSRSYYRELIASGVKIYEFSRGFIHSKTMLCDGIAATVGTVNLDYRSLYLHFECGVLMYKTAAIHEMYKDFTKNMKYCERITDDDCKACAPVRMLQSIIRLFAPLM